MRGENQRGEGKEKLNRGKWRQGLHWEGTGLQTEGYGNVIGGGLSHLFICTSVTAGRLFRSVDAS